jgi:hypothetical protein
VQPDPANERRFATVRRVSEINLGMYRTLFQPFVRASVNQNTTAWMKKLSHAELPFEIFSERNPFMKQVAQLAEQVRRQRQPVAPDNPFLEWQAKLSDGIIAALDGYRDQRDSLLEKTFLAIYSSPILQAMVGLGTSEEPVRQKPARDPGHGALIQERIAQLKAHIAEGGPREAAIRALVYIGQAGAGADERTFNTLRQIRAENEELTLQAFKQIVREQYLSLRVDCEGALAAIPKMLATDRAMGTRLLDTLRRIIQATGEVDGERAKRLAEVEQLFTGAPTAPHPKAASKPATLKAVPKSHSKAG